MLHDQSHGGKLSSGARSIPSDDSFVLDLQLLQACVAVPQLLRMVDGSMLQCGCSQ